MTSEYKRHGAAVLIIQTLVTMPTHRTRTLTNSWVPPPMPQLTPAPAATFPSTPREVEHPLPRGVCESVHPLGPCQIPQLPYITIPSQYLTTAYGDPLLLWDSQYTQDKKRSFLFGTTDHVAALHEAQHMVVDGTFKSAPHLFTQMMGVHGLFEDNWHLPLAFGLLPGKAQALYEDFFTALESFGSFDFQSRMRMLMNPSIRAAKWRRYDNHLERLCNSFNMDTDILEYLKKFSLVV